MSIASLEELFVHELRDVLDAERQILKALPKLARAAESQELQAAFEEHKRVTEDQVDRLETIFKSLDKAARGKHCPGMEGIITEGEELVSEEKKASAARDAALIGAAQKVEHYEIAAYGALAAYARLLGKEEAAELLEATLAEERQTDETLTSIAAELNLLASEEASA